MTEHVLTIGRTNLGRRVWGGPSGSYFGTTGRCSCGAWKDRVNVAPSKGGRGTITRWHAKHVTESATPRETLNVKTTRQEH